MMSVPDEPLDDAPEADATTQRGGSANEPCDEAPGEGPPAPPQRPSKPSRERPASPFFGRDLL